MVETRRSRSNVFREKAGRKEAEQFPSVRRRDAMNSGIKALKKAGKNLNKSADPRNIISGNIISCVFDRDAE